MREIKFRVWNKNNKKEFAMISWEELLSDLHTFKFTIQNPNDHLKLMQFTGLKDKNEKEIFEGDIIKIGGAYDDKNYSIFEITFEEGAFIYRFIKSIEGKENTTGLADSNYLRERKVFLDCEVIGNIYENPELLGEQ